MGKGGKVNGGGFLSLSCIPSGSSTACVYSEVLHWYCTPTPMNAHQPDSDPAPACCSLQIAVGLGVTALAVWYVGRLATKAIAEVDAELSQDLE